MSETRRFRLRAVLYAVSVVVGLGTVLFAQVPVEKVEKADKAER